MSQRRRITLTGCFLVSAALVLAATGAAALRANLTTKNTESARRWLRSVDYTMADVSLRQLMSATDSVAVIRVDRIVGPIWNSSDGKPWAGAVDVPVRVYSRVTATVVDPWAGVRLPTQITIMTLGDATQRRESATRIDYARVSGGFQPGQEFVVLLHSQGFPFQTGNTTAYGLTGEFEGNWRLDGTTVVRGDGQRLTVTAFRQQLGIPG